MHWESRVSTYAISHNGVKIIIKRLIILNTSDGEHSFFANLDRKQAWFSKKTIKIMDEQLFDMVYLSYNYIGYYNK